MTDKEVITNLLQDLEREIGELFKRLEDNDNYIGDLENELGELKIEAKEREHSDDPPNGVD